MTKILPLNNSAPVIDLAGQLSRDVIGRLSVKP